MIDNLVPLPYIISSHTPMARYSLFMLKVPLNSNQPTNQPTFDTVWEQEGHPVR